MQPLVLKAEDQVASGVQRAVFLHPHDDTKVVKVLKRAEDMPARRNFNGRMDRLFPSTRLRQIRKEYQEYLRVMLAHQDPDFQLPITHMFGFTNTSLGLGCISERVMEADGTLGETLGQKAKNGSLSDADIACINDALSRMYRFNIRASDLNAKNFVIGHRHSNGNLGARECVLVDGFGDIHAIPMRSFSKWTNRIGLDDSCARLARNMKLYWDADTRQITKGKN